MEKPKVKVKGIVLDLDGTTVDLRQAYTKAARTGLTSKLTNGKVMPKDFSPENG